MDTWNVGYTACLHSPEDRRFKQIFYDDCSDIVLLPQVEELRQNFTFFIVLLSWTWLPMHAIHSSIESRHELVFHDLHAGFMLEIVVVSQAHYYFETRSP